MKINLQAQKHLFKLIKTLKSQTLNIFITETNILWLFKGSLTVMQYKNIQQILQ